MRALPLPDISLTTKKTPLLILLSKPPPVSIRHKCNRIIYTSEIKDSVEKQPVAKPSFTWEHAEKIITFSYSSQEFTSLPKRK